MASVVRQGSNESVAYGRTGRSDRRFSNHAVTTGNRERGIIRLTRVLLLSCIVFQRLVIPVGSSSTSFLGPLGLAIAGAGFVYGLLAIDRRRVLLFFLLVVLVFLGEASDALTTNPFLIPTGWPSMLQFLLFSAFAVFTFRETVDEEPFFRAVNACFAFVAACGILQFVLQFAGLGLFRFSGFIPPRFLTEVFTGGGFNNQVSIGFGGLFKSNGFFLAEPSIFSQVMAVALAIETLYFRRPVHFGLFVVGLVTSVSGTGWIVLGTFVVTMTVSMGRRGVLLAIALTGAFGLVLLAWYLVLPDVFATFVGRYNEVQSVGSSGQIRFMTPFWTAQEILHRDPWALLTGVGSSVSERFWRPYEGAINTPAKIAVENGLPVLICYVLLITLGRLTPRQRRLLPSLLVLLFVAGAYAHFPPVLFAMLWLIPIARLHPVPVPQPERAARRVRSGRRPETASARLDGFASRRDAGYRETDAEDRRAGRHHTIHQQGMITK